MKPTLLCCLAFLAVFPLAAADVPEDKNGIEAQARETLIERLLDRVVERERALLSSLEQRAPLVETYIQEFGEQEPRGPDSRGPDSRGRESAGHEQRGQGARGQDPLAPAGPGPSDAGHVGSATRIAVPDGPKGDHYFLGRVRFGAVISYESLVEHTDPPQKRTLRLPFRSSGGKSGALSFLPRGFAQMAFMDTQDFNRQTYSFEYVRREFLGEVRCLVFDVVPVQARQPGKFVGRIWVEDVGHAIVRFNGTYVQPPAPKGATPERYFHFDSWRVESSPGAWTPAQIYVEEDGSSSAAPSKDPSPPSARFKAQTRLWDFAASPTNRLDELTSILIDRETGVKDEAATADASPLESQRSWERQAEDNLLARLEKGGLVAPAGPVEQVLNTVVSNLIIAGRLGIEARCRLLLTTPVETFSIGRTIVISRGLLDVLPDEASLALMLAGELAHIALGHRTPTQFAFHSQTMLSDADLLQHFRFRRSPEEMLAAGEKTISIMRASPYQNTANAGLFLKALAGRGQTLPRLLQANLGNQVADTAALARLQAFAESAPALEENKLEQIAALPLGSRIKLDPWTNRTGMVKTRPLALLSPREKMPFEVTPFALYLTRPQPAEK